MKDEYNQYCIHIYRLEMYISCKIYMYHIQI